jgi:hypothetical protein
MRNTPPLPKRFVKICLIITVCVSAAVLAPSINEVMVARRNAEQSEKGPEYQKGMHDSGIFWGAVPPDPPTPPSVQRWPRAQGQDPHR